MTRRDEATIGEYELARITPSVVPDWYAKVTVTAGRDQVAKSYRLLRAIPNTAVDDELLGLRRCDIDLEGARLTVLVQAQQVVGMGRIVTGPKSEAGQRTVSLRDREIAAYLDSAIIDSTDQHRRA